MSCAKSSNAIRPVRSRTAQQVKRSLNPVSTTNSAKEIKIRVLPNKVNNTIDEKAPRRLVFERDSFAFANELLWAYRLSPETGQMKFSPRSPKPDYAHRCFVLVRAARQFLYHARFDAEARVADDAVYRRLVHETVSRNPRRVAPPREQIVIPGFACLREFSAARPQVLKEECGGAWRSYFLRSHWRMVFPISREHQEKTAASLADALRQGFSPIVHLVQFPALTINHGMILFEVAATEAGWAFSACDPNDPQKPATLMFDKAARQFSLPANAYWAGGALKIIEIFASWFL